METTKERLQIFLKHIKISQSRFEKSIDVSNGYVNSMRKGVGVEVLEKIKSTYPELNTNWLITGEGAMLKTDMKEANAISDVHFQNIPFIPIHAQAGYTKGYGDQEYIDQLPTIPVIVDKNYKGKYRVFEVEGDSMDDGSRNSLCEGDKILCREVKQELWTCKLHFKDWYFVMAMKNDGIVVKQITAHDVENGIIHCHSLNPLFEDFEINLRDVAELYNVIKIVDRNTRI